MHRFSAFVGAVVAAASLAAAAAAAPASAADLYGLTDEGRLIRFDTAAPAALKLDVPVGVTDPRGLSTQYGGLFTSSEGMLHRLDQLTGASEAQFIADGAPAGTITSISGQERSPWLRMHSDADQVSDVIPGSQTFGQNQPVAVTPSSLDVRASAEVNEEGGTE